MDELINKMLCCIVIIGAIIPSLVLAFWVNERINEMDVLLSLVISKVKEIKKY